MIRLETPADHAAIRRVMVAAFPAPEEADLVEALRASGDLAISLVVEVHGIVEGAVAFSPMAAPFSALGLAPVAVTPALQGQGLGGALIRAGLEMARGQGVEGVFVLGDPDYYQRFGFSVALAGGFASPYAGAHFMALALQGETLPVLTGRVDHAPAFGALS